MRTILVEGCILQQVMNFASTAVLTPTTNECPNILAGIHRIMPTWRDKLSMLHLGVRTWE